MWSDGGSEPRWIADAAIAWDGAGLLTEVGPWSDGPMDEDLRPGVITPTFVDAHVHFPQSRIVGAASGPLLEWLSRSTFPEESRFSDLGHATRVAQRFTASLARAGTGLAFVYGSVHPAAADALMQAVDRAGLRVIAGPVLMDEGGPPELMIPPGPALEALSALADRWQGHDDRIEVAAIPRFALSCSRELMTGAARLAQERGLWVSTHLSESPEEVRLTCHKMGTADYLAAYEDCGLVHPRSVYAHCIHLSDHEWDRLARAGAAVAHCPDSNDFLGSGGMPLAALRDRGIPLALGTDVAAGRSFRVPRIASAAFDNALRQGLRTTPASWLHAATRGGASALGHDDLGALQPGFQADLVLHDLPAWTDDPAELLGWLLFFHDAGSVRRTWVRGRCVWTSTDASHPLLASEPTTG